MGAVAPIPISLELLSSIENLIVKPTLKGLKEQNRMYRGILYLGLMIHKNYPKVLEFNVRFGGSGSTGFIASFGGFLGRSIL